MPPKKTRGPEPSVNAATLTRLFPKSELGTVVGSLQTMRQKPATLAEMDAAITAELQIRKARGRY